MLGDVRECAAYRMLHCFAFAAGAALCTHALIEALSTTESGEQAYAGYAHLSLGPMLLAIVFVALLSISNRLISRAAGRCKADSVAWAVRALRTLSTTRVVFAVVPATLMLLIGMESTEQWLAFGHVENIASTLGGNPLLTVLLCTAVVFGLTLLSRSVVRSLDQGLDGVISWILAELVELIALPRAARGFRSCDGLPHVRTGEVASRNRALRAPPAKLRADRSETMFSAA